MRRKVASAATLLSAILLSDGSVSLSIPDQGRYFPFARRCVKRYPNVLAIKGDRSVVGTETMPKRKLTLTENRILSVLRKLPGQSIPIEAIAEQSGLTAKRVWVRGRELAQLKLARAILHRVYIGPHFTSTFSLQLEPTSAGRRTST